MTVLHRFARRLARDTRGATLIIVGLSIIPMTIAVGMSIDYARAARIQTKVNAIADAASLAAVTTPMMSKTGAEACLAARRMFVNQVQNIDSLTLNTLDQKQLVITVTDSTGTGNCSTDETSGSTQRTATVTWTGTATNIFGGLLGMVKVPIGGSSESRAAVAPNMDFYLALDTSPSMALPTTSDGFTTMDSTVKCAFACHSNKIEVYAGGSLPNGLILDSAKYAIIKGAYSTSGSGAMQKSIIDDKGSYVYVNRTTTNSSGINSWCVSGGKDVCIYNADGTFVDSYWYALNKGVRLRVTDERSSIADLMELAQAYSTNNKRTYRAALYTFDHKNSLNTIVASPSSLSSVSNAVGGITVATVNDRNGNGCPPTGCDGNNRYLFTSFKSILDKMSSALPAKSGRGSDAPDDSPQAFLFLVTDGMSDEDIGSGRTRAAMQQDQVNQCNAIKARGIKIAILYTEYTTDSIKDDEPGQRGIATAAIPNIAPKLTACASQGLMYTVKTDESMSSALQSLFAQAVKTAHISQ